MFWQWSINLKKLQRGRFQQCLGPLIMLLVERFSETGLFRHASSHVFGVREFAKTKSMEVSFFSKVSNINLHFNHAEKNSEKAFCFWDDCIWIGIVKLSLLRKGYLSLAANMLANGCKIWHITNRDFLQLYCLYSNQ